MTVIIAVAETSAPWWRLRIDVPAAEPATAAVTPVWRHVVAAVFVIAAGVCAGTVIGLTVGAIAGSAVPGYGTFVGGYVGVVAGAAAGVVTAPVLALVLLVRHRRVWDPASVAGDVGVVLSVVRAAAVFLEVVAAVAAVVTSAFAGFVVFVAGVSGFLALVPGTAVMTWLLRRAGRLFVVVWLRSHGWAVRREAVTGR